MIFILVILLLILSLLSYKLNRSSYFSISFISCASMLISSICYCLFYSYIGRDISAITLLEVIGGLMALLLGEIFGRALYLKENIVYSSNQTIYPPEYEVDRKTMIIAFTFEIAVFAIRFIDLYRYSIQLGNSEGILGVIKTVRLSYALGEYTSSSSFLSIATYATIFFEIYSYAYLFYFISNVVHYQSVKLKMLLPLLGYIIIAISFTGRTEYIQIVVMIIWMFLFQYARTNDYVNSMRRFYHIAVRIGIIGVALIILYGFISRNLAGEYSIASTLVSYIGAPLYGLDQMQNSYIYGIHGRDRAFGYYTLQSLHSFLNMFGANIATPPFHHLPFYSYAKGSSNIYTGFLYPILDYGIVGMLISRWFLGFIVGIFERKLEKVNYGNIWKVMMMVILMGLIYYDAMSTYIADRYCNDILSPPTLIKYTIVSYLVLRYGCKYKAIGEAYDI